MTLTLKKFLIMISLIFLGTAVTKAHATAMELENHPSKDFSQTNGAFGLLNLGGLDIGGADFFKAGLGLYIGFGFAEEFLWLNRLNVDFGFTADFYSRPNAYIIGGTPGLRWHFGSVDSKVATSILTGWYIGVPYARATAADKFSSGDMEHGFSAGVAADFHLRRSWYFTVGFNKIFKSGYGSEYYMGWQTRF